MKRAVSRFMDLIELAVTLAVIVAIVLAIRGAREERLAEGDAPSGPAYAHAGCAVCKKIVREPHAPRLAL